MPEKNDLNIVEKKNENSLTGELLNNYHPISRQVLAWAFILSLVFGFFGGVFGGVYVLNNPSFQKFLKLSPQNQPLGQTIALTEESATIDVVKKASLAVVSIVITKDLSKVPQYNPFSPFFEIPQNFGPDVRQVGAGSGFLVSNDGLILTNKHVVSDEQASYTVLIQDGKKFDAKVLARDVRNDLAIVKIDINNAPFLTLADSSKIQIGQRVVAIGNSLGQYHNTVTSGIVSGIGRSITAGSQDGSEQLEGVIQTDAAINPGNSGGPLLNTAAQVIGINTAIDQQGQLVGFAIPANDAAKALESYQKTGKISRPFLGVRYVMITQALAEKEKLPKDYGALITRGETQNDLAVLPGSPADKAGLTENDIILEVNDKKLGESATLASALKNYSVGDEITLKVYDKGEEKMVRVRLEEAK